MTKEQAMRMLHLKKDDIIYKRGLLYLISCDEKRLTVWSLSNNDRQEIERELEALHVLLQYAQ